MQKHVYLSIFLGLLFNTIFFAQTEVEVEVEAINNSDGQTEITIERTIIDEDGNETKYVITKIGEEAEGVMSDEMIREQINNDFKFDCDKNVSNIQKRIIIIEDEESEDDPRVLFMRGLNPHSEHNFHHNPKVRMGVELTDADEGVKIRYVSGNSAAAEGGLQKDDVIILLDNAPVANHQEIIEILNDKEVGDDLLVTYLRDGEETSTSLTLKENIAHSSFHVNTDCDHLDKPCLGVRFNSWNDGIELTSIYENSGADKSGLQKGDRLVRIDGKPYMFSRQFDRMIKSQKPGETIAIEINRDGDIIKTDAEIGIWDECGVCKLLADVDSKPEEVELEQLLPELELNSFDLYPVPAREEITISFIADQAPIEVTLYDVNGKVVDQEIISNFSGSFTKTYDLQEVAKGMALFSITQNGKSTTRQALIQ